MLKSDPNVTVSTKNGRADSAISGRPQRAHTFEITGAAGQKIRVYHYGWRYEKEFAEAVDKATERGSSSDVQ